jgi:hypothetical protein
MGWHCKQDTQGKEKPGEEGNFGIPQRRIKQTMHIERCQRSQRTACQCSPPKITLLPCPVGTNATYDHARSIGCYAKHA